MNILYSDIVNLLLDLQFIVHCNYTRTRDHKYTRILCKSFPYLVIHAFIYLYVAWLVYINITIYNLLKLNYGYDADSRNHCTNSSIQC